MLQERSHQPMQGCEVKSDVLRGLQDATCILNYKPRLLLGAARGIMLAADTLHILNMFVGVVRGLLLSKRLKHLLEQATRRFKRHFRPLLSSG